MSAASEPSEYEVRQAKIDIAATLDLFCPECDHQLPPVHVPCDARLEWKERP